MAKPLGQPAPNNRVKGVRFEPGLLALIETDAQRSGQNFSDWIRDAAIAHLHRPRPGRRGRVPARPEPFVR